MSASYPADLARHIRAQLVHRTSEAPPLSVLKSLFEVMYFASLKSEEAELISCRVAFVHRDNPDPSPPSRQVANRWKHFRLDRSVSFNVRNLVKLSQAVDPWASTLAVDADEDGKLRIWGLIDQSVHYSTYLVRETETGPEMPGVFQAVIQGVGEIAVYRTYLLLGSLKQDTLITKQQRVFQAGPIHSKLSISVERYRNEVRRRVGQSVYEARDHWDDSLEDLWVSALCRILIGIQRYRHGGAILLSDTEQGLRPKYSLKYPRLATSLVDAAVESIRDTHASDEIQERYLEPGTKQIPAQLHLTQSISAQKIRNVTEEVTGCVRFLTSLSRVDGLIWLDRNLCLRGFGAEVTIRRDPVEVALAQDSLGKRTRPLGLDHYGMRHRSVMRFCAAYPDSIGFVVSQDGDIRAVTSKDGLLLLWENVRIQSIRNAKPVVEE